MNRSDKLSKLPIEKRLMSVFRIISLLLSATGIIACVAMGIVSYQYSYALRHYGFAQGDIGKAMIVIAEMRSETRAAIGYDDYITLEMLPNYKQFPEVSLYADKYAMDKIAQMVCAAR